MGASKLMRGDLNADCLVWRSRGDGNVRKRLYHRSQVVGNFRFVGLRVALCIWRDMSRRQDDCHDQRCWRGRFRVECGDHFGIKCAEQSKSIQKHAEQADHCQHFHAKQDAIHKFAARVGRNRLGRGFFRFCCINYRRRCCACKLKSDRSGATEITRPVRRKCSRRSLRAPRLFSTSRRRSSSTESSSGVLRLAIAERLYRKAWDGVFLCKRG